MSDKLDEIAGELWHSGCPHEPGPSDASECVTCIRAALAEAQAAADREGTKRYADKWRAAEAEVERLTRERDEARSRASSLETQWAESDTAKAIFQAMERAEQAEAEVARLRAALEDISVVSGANYPGVLARAALRGEGEK